MPIKIILGILGGVLGLVLFSGENDKPSKPLEKKPKNENENQPIIINNYIGANKDGGSKGDETEEIEEESDEEKAARIKRESETQ